MTRLITRLEVHRYAPELNKLHLRNRQTLPAPGITTIKEAKAHLFGRWQSGHHSEPSRLHQSFSALQGKAGQPVQPPSASDKTTPAPQRARHHHRHSTEVSLIMTTTTTHTNSQQHEAADQPTRIFAQWGLPHTVTPRFGARLIQEHHRLHFLSDRASLVGEWAEEAIDRLEANFPEIIKALETDLLTGKLDAQRQQCTTIQHCGFTCEADSLGSHGYIYIVIYAVANESVTHDTQASPQVLR